MSDPGAGVRENSIWFNFISEGMDHLHLPSWQNILDPVYTRKLDCTGEDPLTCYIKVKLSPYDDVGTWKLRNIGLCDRKWNCSMYNMNDSCQNHYQIEYYDQSVSGEDWSKKQIMVCADGTQHNNVNGIEGFNLTIPEAGLINLTHLSAIGIDNIPPQISEVKIEPSIFTMHSQVKIKLKITDEGIGVNPSTIWANLGKLERAGDRYYMEYLNCHSMNFVFNELSGYYENSFLASSCLTSEGKIRVLHVGASDYKHNNKALFTVNEYDNINHQSYISASHSHYMNNLNIITEIPFADAYYNLSGKDITPPELVNELDAIQIDSSNIENPECVGSTCDFIFATIKLREKNGLSLNQIHLGLSYIDSFDGSMNHYHIHFNNFSVISRTNDIYIIGASTYFNPERNPLNLSHVGDGSGNSSAGVPWTISHVSLSDDQFNHSSIHWDNFSDHYTRWWLGDNEIMPWEKKIVELYYARDFVPDETPPEVIAITFSPSTINRNTGDLGITINVVDIGTGVNPENLGLMIEIDRNTCDVEQGGYVNTWMYEKERIDDENFKINIHSDAFTKYEYDGYWDNQLNKWVGLTEYYDSMLFPTCTWYVRNIMLQDFAYNHRNYHWDEIENKYTYWDMTTEAFLYWDRNGDGQYNINDRINITVNNSSP
jgi:hypothetical protein